MRLADSSVIDATLWKLRSLRAMDGGITGPPKPLAQVGMLAELYRPVSTQTLTSPPVRVVWDSAHIDYSNWLWSSCMDSLLGNSGGID